MTQHYKTSKPSLSSEAPLWMKPDAAATYVGLSVQTLAQYRVRGEGPPFRCPTPRVVRYLRTDLDAWLGETFQSTTAKPAA